MGVVWDLASEKVEEIDPPEPEYVEDPTLAPGTENTINTTRLTGGLLSGYKPLLPASA